MSILNKFAAQQLTKKQMNEVKGRDGGFDNCGQLYKVEWEGNTSYVCEKDKKGMDEFKKINAEFTPVN